jgi:hypothetical protein
MSKIQNRWIAAALILALSSCSVSTTPKANSSLRTTAPRIQSAEAQTPPDIETFLGIKRAEIPRERQNPWTPELEAEFQQRARAIIRFYANSQSYGNTTQENEQRSYPRAMFDFLAGNRERAIAFLQQEDSQVREHAHTNGIRPLAQFELSPSPPAPLPNLGEGSHKRYEERGSA